VDRDLEHFEREARWDVRFLDLAEHVSSWSKDPSTRVGAVIVDRENRVVSMGYNGFPRGVDDSPARYADRDAKYRLTVHAELNALLFANRDLEGCTLYTWPFQPCSRCAGPVAQKGIRRCVAPPTPRSLEERWGADLAFARTIFGEAGVELCILGESV
jgi:dCMP deaminase